MAIVQDPDEALYPGMPRNAVERVPVDCVLALEERGDPAGRIAEKAPPLSVAHFRGRAQEAARNAAAVRRILEAGGAAALDDTEPIEAESSA